MRRRLIFGVAVLACLAMAGAASAQFGHPLKGSWSGDWGSSAASRTHVVVEIGWDGKALNVVVNPGPRAVPLAKAAVDYNTWTVHFEGDGKDQAGATVHYVIDGKLENLGAYQRFITGTWMQGSAKGAFKLTRN